MKTIALMLLLLWFVVWSGITLSTYFLAGENPYSPAIAGQATLIFYQDDALDWHECKIKHYTVGTKTRFLYFWCKPIGTTPTPTEIYYWSNGYYVTPIAVTPTP